LRAATPLLSRGETARKIVRHQGLMRLLAKATTTPQPSARALLENDRFARYPANHVHALFQVLTQGGEVGPGSSA
jgi:hypothetical protein